jgi:hypothetical protein
MGIGFSIFLLALGAILAFAVNATLAGIDISIVGWILMGAGVIGLILTMVVLTPRRRRTVTETTTTPVAGVEYQVTDDVARGSRFGFRTGTRRRALHEQHQSHRDPQPLVQKGSP